MAKLAIVSVFDRAVAGYGRPFFVPSIGAAVRSFMDEVNRNAEDNVMYKHPEDYTLYHIGDFDDSTGAVSAVLPTVVAVGAGVKE